MCAHAAGRARRAGTPGAQWRAAARDRTPHLWHDSPVAGQVTSGGQAGGLVAALGALWAHAVNTRLVLESVGAARYARARPAPAAPPAHRAPRVMPSTRIPLNPTPCDAPRSRLHLLQQGCCLAAVRLQSLQRDSCCVGCRMLSWL